MAAGWVFSDHLGQHAQTHWVGVASIRPDNVLAAITAIERYAEAESMLEECRTTLEEYVYGRTFKADLKALLTKLEARNAGT